MKYTVTWIAWAEGRLADLWTDAPDRAAVSAAVARLDARLARTPLYIGDPVDSSVHRVAYDAPIGIEYEVIEDDKKVIVRGVFWAE